MQGNARGPLRVTQEAVVTYERQTAFQGIRKITVEHAVRVIVPYQGVIQPAWQSAEPRHAGNSGQFLNHAMAFFRNRANPTFTKGGVP